MAKIDIEFRKHIKSLSRTQLEEIIIRIAGKNKEIHDYLLVNYVDTVFGEKDLFVEAANDIRFIFTKNFKGASEQLRLASMIEACVKRINQFQKICKNKNLEADLLLMVLNEIFSYPHKLFGTCFTRFDYKARLLLKRLVTLVTLKLHPDYKLEYLDKTNQYLHFLHSTSDHLDSIYSLPRKI